MNYRLIALDIDGTLMDAGYRISGENLRAIQAATAMGIKVMACSGRVLQETTEIARFAELDDVCIAANGALLHNSQKDIILFEDAIPVVHGVEVINALQKIEGVCFLVYAGDRPTCEVHMFSRYKDKLIGNGYIAGLRRRINLVKDVRSYIVKHDFHIHKILVLARQPAVLQQARDALARFEDIELTHSSPHNLEVMHRGVNKVVALRMYCKHLGIDQSEVMAIGDSLNDIEMLRWAGLGIAMGNAEEAVRRAANHVTQPIEADGVARAIDRFILSVSQRR